MFDLQRVFQRKIWKARQAVKRAAEDANQSIVNAKQKGLEGTDLEATIHFAREEERVAYEHLLQLITGELLDKAGRLMTPVPPKPPRGEDNEYWEEAIDFSGQYLTFTGMKEVKTAIREEMLAPYEPIFKWGGIILGFVGAASGLLAILGIRVG